MGNEMEINTLIKKCECGWKFMNWLVDSPYSCEMNECGWKFINWLVEIILM
jgi:hypothetical protein